MTCGSAARISDEPGSDCFAELLQATCEELVEADTPQARHQAVLDRHWQAMREQAEPDDMYEVGGFQEFHSKTPSFHKSERDRDWRIK
jgi:hypothetical protein